MKTLNISHDKFLIIVVGVGGTGGNFSKELCRLVSSLPRGKKVEIVLVDGDIVEKKNKSRQPFGIDDVAMNKAEILAENLSDYFDLDIHANPNYLSTMDQLTSIMDKYGDHLPILCGCVDNHPARQVMEAVFKERDNIIYIDSGNEDWYGEVVCGVKANGQVIMPSRAHYFPEVLTDNSPSKLEESCEVVNRTSPQHLVTNLQAAVIMLSYVSQILVVEKLSGNISYFDVGKKFVRTSSYLKEE